MDVLAGKGFVYNMARRKVLPSENSDDLENVMAMLAKWKDETDHEGFRKSDDVKAWVKVLFKRMTKVEINQEWVNREEINR